MTTTAEYSSLSDPSNFGVLYYYYYRAMLSKFFFKQIEEEDLDNIWFQQDGATCHTAKAALNLLRPIFENRIISKRGDVNWLPRSCDLTQLDYFLWEAVKDKCYANHPETIQDLKYEIQAAVAAIRHETIEKVHAEKRSVKFTGSSVLIWTT